MSMTRRTLLTRGPLMAGLAGAAAVGLPRTAFAQGGPFSIALSLSGLYGLATDKRGANLGAVDVLMVNYKHSKLIPTAPHIPKLIVPKDCVDSIEINKNGPLVGNRYEWMIEDCEVSFTTGQTGPRYVKAPSALRPNAPNFKYCPSIDEWRELVWIIDFEYVYGPTRNKIEAAMRNGYKKGQYPILASRLALPRGHVQACPPSEPTRSMLRWRFGNQKPGPKPNPAIEYRQLFTDAVKFTSHPSDAYAVEVWPFTNDGVKPATPDARVWLRPSEFSGQAQVYVENNAKDMSSVLELSPHVKSLYELLLGDHNHAEGQEGDNRKCDSDDVVSGEPPVYCPPVLL